MMRSKGRSSFSWELDKRHLPGLLKDYKTHKIYNIDKTGLFYKALLLQTLMFKSETAGFKKSKGRVTRLLICNMDAPIKKTPWLSKKK
ncbi:hypothetical protein X975_17969, partial [Stegodyphus mimosarum]